MWTLKTSKVILYLILYCVFIMLAIIDFFYQNRFINEYVTEEGGQKVWHKVNRLISRDLLANLKRLKIREAFLLPLSDWVYHSDLSVFPKKYSKIDQHLARHFRYNSACLSSPPPFLCGQIIIPFSNSMISTNQETGLRF